MTEDMIDLQAMVGKSPDADFLRDMIGFAAKRLMELEVGGPTGAAHGEKDAERLELKADPILPASAPRAQRPTA